MKNNQDIGSALKSKLEDLQNSPDDFVWDAIEEKLKKKRRRLLFWYFTFGLGILILSLFIFNPFNNGIEGDINVLNSSEKNIEIVEHEAYLNSVSKSNFKDKNSTKPSSATITTENKSSNDSVLSTSHDNVSSTVDSKVLTKETLQNTTNSKNSRRSNSTSENQKLANSVLNKTKSDTSSQTNDLNSSGSENSLVTNKNNSKSLIKTNQTEEQKSLTERNMKKASDSLIKIADEVLAISEEEKKEEEILDDNKKVKDSVTERETKWSINPQLIQSNYGAFNAETADNTSINYGLLLGVRMTSSTFLRFGVRKLDLMQTVNNAPNTVSYLEIPLEVKYFFRDKKFNPYLTGGISYFILNDQGAENPNNLDYSDHFSLNLGLGLEHKLVDRFYINVESNFNYQIKPTTSNIDYTPYIFSISTGIDYRF